MVDTYAASPGQRRALENVARDLQEKHKGVFGQETVTALVLQKLLQAGRVRDGLTLAHPWSREVRRAAT